MKRIIALLMMLAVLTGCAAVSPSGSEAQESSSSAQSSAALSESQAQEPQEEFSVAPQIAMGYTFIIGLDNEGHVVGEGENKTGEIEYITSWENIVQIDAGEYHSAGLTEDGHVKISTKRSVLREGVSDWENIVQVSVGSSHTVGLTADGHAYAAGENAHGECDVANWEDLVLVEAGCLYTLGLTSTGNILVTGDFDGELPDTLTDVTAMAAGRTHVLFLKSDGTVQAFGSNEYGQCDVTEWTNIKQIAAGGDHSVGLTYDGKVVAVGDNGNSQSSVIQTEDVYAISAFSDCTAVLNSGGVIYYGRSSDAYGYNYNGYYIRADISVLAGGYILEVPAAGKDTESRLISMQRALMGVSSAGHAFTTASEYAGNFGNIVQAVMTGDHYYYLTVDGKVIEFNGGRCKYLEFDHIKQIAASEGILLCLKENGSILSYQAYEKESDDVRLDICGSGMPKFNDIALTADGAYGITESGRIYCAGTNLLKGNDITNAVKVVASDYAVAVLTRDGHVYVAGSYYNRLLETTREINLEKVSEWSNIVDIAIAYGHIAALDDTGKVYVYGTVLGFYEDVANWTDIVQVAAGQDFIAGLKSDGTVVYVGNLYVAQDGTPVETWDLS